jgi:hypothetical protein
MNWEEYIENLWTERLVWVRQLILSIMLSLRDLNFVAERVQRNTAEFGQILGSVYGLEAGQKFEYLFNKYILILSEIVPTIKSGQNTDILMQQWLSVAEEIAEFLSQLNPYWDKSEIEALIRNQIQLEFDFASDLKKEKFEQGIANFDPAYDNARKAGQLMIDGTKMYLGLENL